MNIIRVVFTGSESTGKSTLAAEIARHYGVEVVPEFVRKFAEERGGVIEFSDHGAIARGQMALEDEYIARAVLPAPPSLAPPPERGSASAEASAERPRFSGGWSARPRRSVFGAKAGLPASPALLIQDTDLLSTVVYCRHYFGRCPEWIEDAALERRPDLYLLCNIDVPWVPDGVRDRGHMRDEMQRLFEAAVQQSQAASANISGSPADRLARAIDIIDQLMRASAGL